MTTREEFAKLADYFDCQSNIVHSTDNVTLAKGYDITARVLRQLAEGAVLCKVVYPDPYVSRTGDIVPSMRRYIPIEEQP